MLMLIKKSLFTSLTLRSCDSGELMIVFSTKVSLLNVSASHKATLFSKNFSKNSNVYDLGMYLPDFYLELIKNSIIFL